MSRPAIASVARDLQGVLSFFQKANLIPGSFNQELQTGIKKVHRATYSLILWKFRLRPIPTHARPFIDEIASDALQILPHSLSGYIKTTHLLIRGIIENSVRYLYFFDHPVEFKKMNSPKKWYLEPKELFEYASTHPTLAPVEGKFHAIGTLKSLYSELSEKVHGGRVADLEMRVSLSKIVFEQKALNEHVRFVENCAEAVNFLLCTFHIDKFRGFQLEDRRIILQSISAKGRNILSHL